MNDDEEKRRAHESGVKPRYSLGQMLVFTAIVSVVLMILVTLAPPLWSLAMTSPSVRGFFGNLFGQASWSRQISFSWRDYVREAPQYVVWIVGCVLLVRRRSRHPQVSLFALAGLIGFLILRITDMAFVAWISAWMQSQTAPTSLNHLPHDYVVLNSPYREYLRPLIEVGSWSLLLCAILGWRRDRSNEQTPTERRLS